MCCSGERAQEWDGVGFPFRPSLHSDIARERWGPCGNGPYRERPEGRKGGQNERVVFWFAFGLRMLSRGEMGNRVETVPTEADVCFASTVCGGCG